MSLKDKIVRTLALRWLRGKLNALRGKERETNMGKALKFLEGWKLLIGITILFLAKVYDGASNGHAGNIVGNVLSIFGWMPGPQSGFTFEGVTVAAASALTLVGYFAKLWRAQQQVRAGSSLVGSLATEGYLAKAVSDAVKSEVKNAELTKVVDKATIIAEAATVASETKLGAK